MKHCFSIMPMDENRIDEICEDIRYQYNNGIADCALFEVELVPEYDPPIDKAAEACARYDRFSARLHEMGLSCGILVQCTIGHGYKLNRDSAFEKYVCLEGGAEMPICCPYGEGFRDYIREQMAALAEHGPEVILVDDDLRLTYTWGRGCACPRHMARFHALSGTAYTREELYALESEGRDKNDALWNVFMQTQRESLLGAARAMREGIDSVDPRIQGGFCSTISIEFADEIADILAGEGNPRLVRLNTGNYHPLGARELTRVSYRAAYGNNVLRKKDAVLLAETDTCPQNRYSTSARSMHATYVASILEGAGGAKHWITRLSQYEAHTGDAYRAILKKYAGFYDTLIRMFPTLSWQGCRIPLPKQHRYTFAHTGFYEDFSGWSTKCLERLGFPVYFSSENNGCAFLDGGIPGNLSDKEIETILSGPCVLSSDAAERLTERGYGPLLGVSVREWDGDPVSYERIGEYKSASQFRGKALTITDGSACADSHACHLYDGKTEKPLYPASVIYKNRPGGTVVTFSGTPTYEQFHYGQAFSFLNSGRKQQLSKILASVGALPVFYPGDAEVFLKTALLPDGTRFCAFTDLSFDPLPEIMLKTGEPVHAVSALSPDGVFRPCEFSTKNGTLTVFRTAETLLTEILLLS